MSNGLYAIPKSWHWTTMGEISAVVGGGTPRTADLTNFEGGTIPWVTPADLSGYSSKYISHGERSITRKGLETSSARMLPAGTVLFTSRAPIGYIAIASNPVCTNQGFKSFVLKDDVVPDYVYWWLKGNKELTESVASGTTFLELSGAKAKLIPIPIAPLDEQKRIVAEIEKQFSRLDEAVTSLKRGKVNLKRYKAAVLKAAVEGKLTEQWRKENPDVKSAEKLLERILAERRKKWEETELNKMRAKGKEPKDDSWRKEYKWPVKPGTDNLNDLPKGWIWIRLEQVAERITKGSSPNWQGFNYVEKGIPFVRSQNVLWGELDISDIAYLPKEFNQKESRSVLMAGDVLLNIVGASIGRSAIVPPALEGSNVNQAVAIIRLIRRGLNNAFLMNYLISSDAQEKINKRKVDVARANLSLTDIGDTIVPLPPESEQRLIVDEIDKRLSSTERFLAEIEKNLMRAERLRQSILKKAFSGRLVLQIKNQSPN